MLRTPHLIWGVRVWKHLCPLTDASLVRSGLRRKNTIEDDTDSDEEIFRRSQSRRTRGQRSQDAKVVMAKEFVMNGDDSRLQDMEEGEAQHLARTLQ